MRTFHDQWEHLCDSLKNHCAPLEPHFSNLKAATVGRDVVDVDSNDVEFGEADEAKFLKKVNQLNSQVLKTIETLYKKYLSAAVTSNADGSFVIKRISSEQAGCFALECLANFIEDVETLDLKSINRSLDKLATSLAAIIYNARNAEFMCRVISEFRVLKAYIDLFAAFATKWYRQKF